MRAQRLQRSYVTLQNARSQAEGERVGLQRALATAAAERDGALAAAVAAHDALEAGRLAHAAGLAELRAKAAAMEVRPSPHASLSLWWLACTETFLIDFMCQRPMKGIAHGVSAGRSIT